MMGYGLDSFEAVAAVAALYLALAYLILPALWSSYEHEPALREFPMRTRTREGIPGDPLNVGLIGTGPELIAAMTAGSWSPADPITLKTSIEIVGSVLFDRPDPYAPVSDLYFEERRQDFAFEKAVGRSAGQRHHVRFWHVLDAGKEGRPVWLGAATFDKGVGISHYTGQITHHIAADVDAERERLIGDLARVGCLSKIYRVSGIGPTVRARNGGGDLFYTDGDIVVGVVRIGATSDVSEPATLGSPATVAMKNRAWQRGKLLMKHVGWLPE